MYSEDGRDYYLLDVEKNPESDDLSYSYVVFFNLNTPAGRTALSKMMALAELSAAVDLNQIYYVAAVQYLCHFSLKEPNNISYEEIFWTDRDGNAIVKLEIKPEDSTTIKAQVAEISTYSESYLQKIFDALEESNKAQRENLEAHIQLEIDTGHEDRASQMKFEPTLRKYLPALCLVISGGTKHMLEVSNAAKQVFEKRTRK